ncbi:MAG: homoserine dehydrogenase [Deltaproteobacteria bacterium]|nr:homoserine dehydrogenase [Deltaproteobacteria bacterium]
MKDIVVGLIGFGTVGAGAVDILLNKRELVRDKLGSYINLKKIADLDLTTDRGVEVDPTILTTNAYDVINDPDIQIVIELIGGYEPARTFILEAIKRGKHVVTANKALLANHGAEIFAAAIAGKTDVAFEASVCGGIPVIRAIREGLTANSILRLCGILNGTANYILTKMSLEGVAFADALKQAQNLGYAEADPTYDVEGIDTAHKLAILISLSYGAKVDFHDKNFFIEGITGLTPLDIAYAADLGYRVKLMAISRIHDDGIEARVHPTMIPKSHVLANVLEAYNAVHITGHAVGDILLYGLGAGRMPTGSAVVSDLIDLGRNILNGISVRVPPLSFMPDRMSNLSLKPIDDLVMEYYMRFTAMDQPGVLATIGGILGKHNISLAAVLQKGRKGNGNGVPVIMLTHEAREADVQAAVAEIDQTQVVVPPTMVIRIES